MTKVNNIQNIGQQIKAKRIKDRLSAEDLAAKLGLKSTNIYKWERGSMPSKPDEYLKITQWLNNLDHIPNTAKKATENTSIPETITDTNVLTPYLKLLEDNDRFFKNEYHNLLLSLKELVAQGQRAERLLKLNLQHIGTVEALQKGIEEDVVQEQIGNQIAGIPEAGEKDNDGDT